MTTIGYIRVSTEHQDMLRQRHLLLDYAQREQMVIAEFVEIVVSTQRSTEERQIEALINKLEPGDTLLVSEMSRLGRNILECLQAINTLDQKNVHIIFVTQPELSTVGAHRDILLGVYSGLAQAERRRISERTKEALAAAKAQGKLLGRPKGSRSRNRVLGSYYGDIKEYLETGLNLTAVMKIINKQLDNPIAYQSYRYFVLSEPELAPLWQQRHTT